MSKHNFAPELGADPDDIGNNVSANPSIQDVLALRASRRGFLRGSAGGAGMALFGSLGLASCTSDGSSAGVKTTQPGLDQEKPPALLGFSAVAKSVADAFVVPAGYTAAVLYACGDPLFSDADAARNDGSDANYERRAGDHHDGMEYFGLSVDGRPLASGSERGVLAVNHEYINPVFLHANGPTSVAGARPAAEVNKEIACHGVSVLEIRKGAGGRFAYVVDSPFNRRVTAATPVELSGPARGSALLATRYDPSGQRTRGTLNNCGTGKTPWGTVLTGEENWSGYFTRGSGDDARRSAKEVTALKRYGRAAGKSSRYGWESAGASDEYARWDISATAASAAGDFRNEMNGQGYLTEIDPYNASSLVKKRTATGRFAHEGAAFSLPQAGRRLAVYMGDDSQGEYVYKFVSDAAWDPADATAANRMAAGDKYLDKGRLYAARFNADGSGDWLELSLANPRVAGFAGYAFADQADVLVHARLAADAAGATRMDRPEWCATHPQTGEIYFTMTNNSSRAPGGVDAANPRSYTDLRSDVKAQSGNVNGHIIRLAEQAGADSLRFAWDIYLFGAEAGAPASVNLSGLNADNDFSSPDGLAFAASTGICWIQTDDGAYNDVTNDQMLAALPGTVGDGGPVTVDNGGATVNTYRGALASNATLKRFLVGPRGCEITGVAETPDGRTLFVNVQHPGEDTKASDLGDPGKYQSQWPANAGYGAGRRPRSSTVMITKNDGGKIGT
ncbi:phosphatase [Xenophilus sp. AP218F]|nr:phosphatase [Xenophilus sp. AP218F]